VTASFPHPVVVIAGFLLAGRSLTMLAILNHEAAHRLLFSNRRVNDAVGRWLCAYPVLSPIDAYRRGHMAHHRQEFGPDEPDMVFYAGYPCGWRSFGRKLWRDAIGVSGWKNLKPLFTALASSKNRPVAARILGVQAVLFGAAIVAGHWWLYPLLWLAPWMTIWRVSNRLRSIAEHGGLQADPDRRATTHHVRQSWLARFWLVPFNTGWHLAHHVDSGIPWRNLPALQRELEAAGYVPAALEWPSYLALWRSLVVGRPAVGAEPAPAAA
jgi:fatty acid desaturase